MQDAQGGRLPQRLPSATFPRRVLCLIYEGLLLTAVAFAATAVIVTVAHLSGHTLPRFLTQIYLGVVAGCYFVAQWRAGQTLPMRTWRIRVVSRTGAALTTGRATLRYLYALASVLAFGAGFLWGLVDRDGQFLHDRLAGTRLVALPKDGQS